MKILLAEMVINLLKAVLLAARSKLTEVNTIYVNEDSFKWIAILYLAIVMVTTTKRSLSNFLDVDNSVKFQSLNSL